jgi:hypothetical protein
MTPSHNFTEQRASSRDANLAEQFGVMPKSSQLRMPLKEMDRCFCAHRICRTFSVVEIWLQSTRATPLDLSYIYIFFFDNFYVHCYCIELNCCLYFLKFSVCKFIIIFPFLSY